MDGCFIGDPRFFLWINKNGKKNLINLIMDKFLCESDQQKSDKVIHQCLNTIYIEYKKYKDECNRLKLKVDQLEAQLKRCSCHENTPSPPSSSLSSSAAAAAAAPITPPIATDGSNSKKRKSPENSQQDVEELQPPPTVPFQSKLTSQPIDSNVILAPETEYDCFEQFNNAINDSEQFNETISETPEQLAKSNAKKLLSNNKKKCKSSSTTSTCSSASSSSSSSSLLSLSPMKLSSPGRSPLMQLSNNEQRKVNSNKQQQQQQQIQNTTIPGLLLSPDKYYDAAEFDDCLPKRQKNLNTSLKENTSMDKSLSTASSSSSFSSKWISKKSKLYNNISNDLNISFIQPIFPKKKNQIDMKLSNDDDGGGGAGDGANPNGRKTQLNDTKRIKLKQATLSFQKKIDDIRQINVDDSNATFCADITQPNFSDAGTVGTGGQHQKPLRFMDNNQQQPQQDKRIKENLFNFSKIKENKLSSSRRPVEEDKKETIISSSNNNNNNKNIDLDKIKIENIYNNRTNKLSNITTNPVSPSIIEIKRNDTTDNNSSVILIEDTQPIFTIENDSDENSSDLIEKMNKNNNNIVNVKSKKNGNYCGETSPIRKKSEKLKRPGFLCNECSKYYNIMDLTDEEYMKRVNQCSNHRKPQHIKETPEGFWNPFITPATGNGADETNSSQSP